MKIIQIFIAMLIFASPAFGVTVRCSDEGNGVVRIEYDATDEDALPLAFALDITVDNGATIEAISGYKIGDSTANVPGYGIFPRSIIFDDGGKVADWGFPDVKPDADTTGVKPGLGTNGITIEMGARYKNVEDAPLKNAMLFRLDVNNNGAQAIYVQITPNTAGGGVVLEDATIANVNAVGCTLNYSDTIPTNMVPTITSLTVSPSSIYEHQSAQLQVTANDPDNSPSVLTYNWVVPSGAGSVDNAQNSQPNYFPPNITTTQTFTVTMNVSDGQDTVSGAVSITVQPEIIESPDPDTITIKKAEYKVGDKELKVEATSSAQPNATLSVNGYGTMVWQADEDRYELRIKPTTDPGAPITVTSDLGGTSTKSITYTDISDDPPEPEPEQDTITIKKAEYDPERRRLKVEATSSAQPDSVLTVEGYGTMVWKAIKNKYVLRKRRAADPGGSITVTSSIGASTTKTITYDD